MCGREGFVIILSMLTARHDQEEVVRAQLYKALEVTALLTYPTSAQNALLPFQREGGDYSLCHLLK